MLLFALTLLSILSAVSGSALKKNQICFDAVFESYSYVSFAGDDPDVYYYSACQYAPKVLSIYAAAEIYCKRNEINPGMKLLSDYCHEYGPDLELVPLSHFAANLSSAAIMKLPVVDLDEAMSSEPFDQPILISKSFFDAMYKTVVSWEYEMWTHHTYGFAMYGFWGAILLIGMIHNAFNTLHYRRLKTTRLDSESLSYLNEGRVRYFQHIQNFVNQHFIVPFTFGSHHQRTLYGCAIPTRLVGIVIVSYWSLSLILCAVNIHAFTGNLYWSEISPQVWRYLADRTGIMAFSNLPLLWIFAGRNNVFLWATGWKFSTLNIFHRNVARVATIEAIVHSVAYTVIYLQDGKEEYYESYDEAWFCLGVVATVLMSTILIVSSILLRRKAYEFFLILHILMSVAVIVSLFYHVSDFDGEYNPYLWPLVAIWSFDRLLRLVRLAYCNIRARMSRELIEVTTAVARYSAEGDVITLEVAPRSSLLKPKPGLYFFLYQPFSWKGWENHPFTLGAWSASTEMEPKTEGSVLSNAVLDKEMERSLSDVTREVPTESSSASSEPERSVPEDIHLTFWIRPFDGWTRQLRDKCKGSTDGLFRVNLLLEGPYGHCAPLDCFESVLLIAGGTGISAVNPYIQEHMRLLRSGMPTRTRSMHLIFAARSVAFVEQLYQKQLHSARRDRNVCMEFYTTADNTTCNDKDPELLDSPVSPTSVSTDSVDVDGKSPAGPERVSARPPMRHGRPDIISSVLNFSRECHAAGTRERTAVMVCGPAGMADEARRAAVKALSEGLAVEYFEEAFGW